MTWLICPEKNVGAEVIIFVTSKTHTAEFNKYFLYELMARVVGRGTKANKYPDKRLFDVNFSHVESHYQVYSGDFIRAIYSDKRDMPSRESDIFDRNFPH